MPGRAGQDTLKASPLYTHLRPWQEGKSFPKSGNVVSKPLQKRLRILQVRERNHRWNAIVLVGFGLFYLSEAGFEFGYGLAGQGTGTEVGNECFPNMRHGVVRGIEVVKPTPMLIRDEVRRERVQQLEVMVHRNCILFILQCRQDELLAEPLQQPADDIAVRAQVALLEDLFFEDVVWREEAHLFKGDGNHCSALGGSGHIMILKQLRSIKEFKTSSTPSCSPHPHSSG